MEPPSCMRDLTEHEEILKQFISDLESREKNFTESLKKINDTLEALVNAKTPEIPEFILRDPSELNSVRKKKNKKRSRSKKQCVDDPTAEFGCIGRISTAACDAIKSPEVPKAMSLKNLAKKFEEGLKKAKEQGLSWLVEPIKESAKRLRELSQAECDCEFEATLDVDEQEHDIEPKDRTKIYRSNANKETVEQTLDKENGVGTFCGCNEWGGDRLNEQGRTCDQGKEMFNVPKDDWPRAPCKRKTPRHHKSKDKKNANIYVDGRMSKKRIDKHLKIQDPDICDCTEDQANDKLKFDKNATEKNSIISESCAYNAQDDHNTSRSCEDLDIDQSQSYPECLKKDLSVLRSLIQNLTAIDKSVIDKDRDKKDPNVSRSIRDESMIQGQKRDYKAALKGTRTQGSHKEAVQNNSEVTRSLMLDHPMIYGSSVDKNLAGKIIHERCPLDDGANVKDESCQCVDDAEESGRTNRSKRRLKDHAVKDGEEANREFNVKIFQTPSSAHREATRADRIARSSPDTKEIIILKGTYLEDKQSDSEDDSDNENYGREKFDSQVSQKIFYEKTICPCGCDAVEEPVDQLCPCGCPEVVELHVNDASKDEENVQLFCEPTRSRARKKKKCFEEFRGEVRSTLVRKDPLKKCCPCGCAEILQEEDNEMSEVEDNALSRIEYAGNGTRENNEDIDELAKKLEEEIYSVKAKNDDLKKLIKSCYCDEDVDEILALQWSQLPPIRATHSGLTAAIEVLRSKCHTKDHIITVLAGELRGSKDVDQIAKNLTAPCLQFTYWDFDQCGLYSYLQSPKLLSNAPKVHKADKKMLTERPKEEISQRQLYQTPKPTNFRVVREICNCLLVSWNIPEDIRGLRGYEIVINGKVVAARVRNPTRTEAVLGPFDLSESAEFPGSIVLTLYAIDSHGQYSEPSNIKF